MNGLALRALVLSVLIGGAALAAVVAFVGGDEVGALRDVRPGWLAAAAAALLASFASAGARLCMLVRRGGGALTLRHATRAHVLGLFGSAVTPGGSGGVPAVGLVLTRQGVPRATAWAAVVAATTADTVLFGWSIPAALLILGRLGALPSGPAFTVASVLVSAIALTAAYLLAFRLHWAGPVARVVLRGRLARLRPRAERFVRDLIAAQEPLRRAPWSWHLRFHAVVALSWWCLFAVLWATARGFDLEAPLHVVLAALTLVHGVGTFVPTPGGSGFYEFGGSLALVSVGAREGVAATVIVWRLLSHYTLYLLGPMLGGYLLLRPDGRSGGAAPAHGTASPHGARERGSGRPRTADGPGPPAGATAEPERGADR